MIYFDNASTTKLRPDLLTTYQQLLDKFWANQSSIHEFGLNTADFSNKAKAKLLEAFNLVNYKVIYTGGASEANNLFLKGLTSVFPRRGKVVITSKIEHPSVLNSLLRLENEGKIILKYVNLTANGEIDYVHLEQLIDKETLLICLMSVNNETGSVTNISEIRRLIETKHKQTLLFSDVTQAVGKINIPYQYLDGFSFSAHKIHGFKGSGALILKNNIPLSPLIDGGLQQEFIHSGTINSPLNILLTKTVRLSLEDMEKTSRVKSIAEKIYTYLKGNEQVLINSSILNPYIINFSLLNHKSSVVVQALSKQEIYVSSHSACSEKILTHSEVLLAIYHEATRAENSIRVSLSVDNSEEETDVFIKALDKILKETRKNNGK